MISSLNITWSGNWMWSWHSAGCNFWHKCQYLQYC